MVDKHLAKAVIDIAVFLEFSDENILDADASVVATEQLASELQLMSNEHKESLIHCINDMAKEYGDKAEFVENLAESLGLV